MLPRTRIKRARDKVKHRNREIERDRERRSECFQNEDR